jgi:hypothetical protein
MIQVQNLELDHQDREIRHFPERMENSRSPTNYGNVLKENTPPRLQG